MTITSLLTAPPAIAVAYCALRDPVSTIFQLYPEAKSYRSDVRTVGSQARNQVHRLLPFKMHFNELGRHTLYIALDGPKVLGFVHARSERGEWGLTEIAWAITPSLEIRGMTIQRSRDPHVRRQLQPKFMQALQGQSLATLTTHLASAGDSLVPLEKTFVESAIKTLVITANVWGDLVLQPNSLAASRQWFPGVTSAVRLNTPYDQRSRQQLELLDLWQSPVFERSKLDGYRLLGAEGETLGFTFSTVLDYDSRPQKHWWVTANDGEIKTVVQEHKLEPDPNFSMVLGYAPEHARDCSSLVELAALEISTIARLSAR